MSDHPVVNNLSNELFNPSTTLIEPSLLIPSPINLNNLSPIDSNLIETLKTFDNSESTLNIDIQSTPSNLPILSPPSIEQSDHQSTHFVDEEEEVIGSGIPLIAQILSKNTILQKDHTLAHASDTPVDPHQFDTKHLVFYKPPPNTISRLPLGSRMFVGNLSSAKTTHADVATIFAKYGNIFEIVLRGSYGFVQFETIEACHEAIKCETGNSIQGLKFGMCHFTFI